MTKRALVLGGGGPALGTIIGSLDILAARGMMPSFEVVSASCIGAWVAVVHWASEGTPEERRVQQTYEWFKPVFQPESVHDSFPINKVFAMDSRGQTKAYWQYLTDPRTYRKAWVPAEMFRVGVNTLRHMTRPQQWLDESTFNLLLLEWMGAHPTIRLWTGLQYRTAQTGAARIFYQDAPLLRKINIPNLYKPDRPEIRYNAINLEGNPPRPVLFTNRVDRYGMVDQQTLCACSALPSIFAPVEVDGQMHCEGATVDTVQFINLIEDHPDLDEIWVIRIVALDQAQAPADQTAALANSFMIFASALGEANIQAFRTHASSLKWHGRIIEVPVPRIKWEWSLPNLDRGRRLGAHATLATLDKYNGVTP